jgi:hypothetical protein
MSKQTKRLALSHNNIPRDCGTEMFVLSQRCDATEKYLLELSRRIEALEAKWCMPVYPAPQPAAIPDNVTFITKPTITRAEALAIAEAAHYSCSATIQRMNAIEQFASRMGVEITP